MASILSRKPLTGEPYARNLPVRFGGRGSGKTLSLPLFCSEAVLQIRFMLNGYLHCSPDRCVLWLAAGGTILLLGIGALVWKRGMEPASVTRGSSSATSSQPGQVSSRSHSRTLLEMLQTSAAGLQNSEEPTTARQRLEELRQALA